MFFPAFLRVKVHLNMAGRTVYDTNEDGDSVESYARRSRGGCWTCRRLHKKCDEQRPKCGPCQRYKRDCEGYEIRLIWMPPRAKSRSPRRSRRRVGRPSISAPQQGSSLESNKQKPVRTPEHLHTGFVCSSTDVSTPDEDSSQTADNISLAEGDSPAHLDLIVNTSAVVDDHIQARLLSDCKSYGNVRWSFHLKTSMISRRST